MSGECRPLTIDTGIEKGIFAKREDRGVTERIASRRRVWNQAAKCAFDAGARRTARVGARSPQGIVVAAAFSAFRFSGALYTRAPHGESERAQSPATPRRGNHARAGAQLIVIEYLLGSRGDDL